MINLKVEKREKVGGLSSKKAIKEDKKVPAIIYGGDKEPMPVFLQNNELIKIPETPKTSKNYKKL